MQKLNPNSLSTIAQYIRLSLDFHITELSSNCPRCDPTPEISVLHSEGNDYYGEAGNELQQPGATWVHFYHHKNFCLYSFRFQ